MQHDFRPADDVCSFEQKRSARMFSVKPNRIDPVRLSGRTPFSAFPGDCPSPPSDERIAPLNQTGPDDLLREALARIESGPAVLTP